MTAASALYAPPGVGLGRYRMLDSVREGASEELCADYERRIYEAIASFPELNTPTVTVGVCPESWGAYARADTHNDIIFLPVHERVSTQTIYHELAHLAITQLDDQDEDVPTSSEEFCSIFAVARMDPDDLEGDVKIPYIGTPGVDIGQWPGCCRRALEYRERRGANSHYIKRCRELLKVDGAGGASE